MQTLVSRPTAKPQAVEEIERKAETILDRMIPRDLLGAKVADSFHDAAMTITRSTSGVRILVRIHDDIVTVFETCAWQALSFRPGFWQLYLDTLYTAAINKAQYRPMAIKANLNFLPIDDAEAFMPPDNNDPDEIMVFSPAIEAAIRESCEELQRAA